MLIAAATAALLASAAAPAAPHFMPVQAAQPVLSRRSVPLLHEGALVFKDMNRNGRLDRYEDWRLTPQDRAKDLLKRMSLAQKAGLLVHPMAPMAKAFEGPLDLSAIQAMIERKQIRYMLNYTTGKPSEMAEEMNRVQEMAEAQPLAIPVTISSDPRNHISSAAGQSVAAGRFSEFPESIGLGATGDAELVRNFGRIAGSELRAVGIHMTLSPMADLASEPRWGRQDGTFGSDPETVGRLTAAYIEGFQGGRDGLQPGGVATVVKHWVGYGAEPEGIDAHDYRGRTLKLNDDSLSLHIRPFEQAFAVHAAGVMPTYGQPAPGLTIKGQPAEQVGAGFSKQMLQTMLRGQYGFDGIVITDFLITADCQADCQKGTMDLKRIGMPWGVEALTPTQRIAKALNAGVDQIGGASDADIVLALARKGEIAAAGVDASVLRLLAQKFALGEFENPYADPAQADATVGTAANHAAALDAQHRSLTLLKGGATLPLKPGAKVWAWNVAPDVLRAHGFVPAASAAEADVALLRIAAPYRLREDSFFGAFIKEGPISYPPGNKDMAAFAGAVKAGKPVVVVAHLDRPAILTDVAAKADALFVDYGASDAAVLDVVAGKACPGGRLPYELPSSDAAVAAQRPDLPDDSASPLYPRGAGLVMAGCTK